jgi:uncharacterized phage protein (TIGR01671 family)
MNRQVVFRGYDESSGLWRYGFLLFDGRLTYISQIIQGKIARWRVNPNTVGQFTGLHDKHGKKIFEGDIVYSEFSDGSNCHCLVGWNDEEACFGLMDEYAFRSKREGYGYPKFDSLVLSNFFNHGIKFDVIGNIHDNPELLTTR